MNTAEVHQYLLDQFGADSITGSNLEAKDPWIEVAPAAIVEVCQFLHDDEQLQFDHLNNLTGVDYCEPDKQKQNKFGHEPHIEVVYHLSSIALKHRTTIKVMLPRWENETPGDLPKIDSVSSVWKIADWHERETYDLVGIEFKNHPNLRRILCPEDWVGHALRKDYDMPLEYHGIRGK